MKFIVIPILKLILLTQVFLAPIFVSFGQNTLNNGDFTLKKCPIDAQFALYDDNSGNLIGFPSKTNCVCGWNSTHGQPVIGRLNDETFVALNSGEPITGQNQNTSDGIVTDYSFLAGAAYTITFKYRSGYPGGFVRNYHPAKLSFYAVDNAPVQVFDIFNEQSSWSMPSLPNNNTLIHQFTPLDNPNQWQQITIPFSPTSTFSQLWITNEFIGSAGNHQSSHILIDDIIITSSQQVVLPSYNPSFSIDNIVCLEYGKYEITVNNTPHHTGGNGWKIYADNKLNVDPSTEIQSLAIPGSNKNTETFILTADPGDEFVIKHGTYSTCVRWKEKRKKFQIPCGPYDTGFTVSNSCVANEPKITVKGEDNPCDAYWQYNLFDKSSGAKIETISWYNNHPGNVYNANSYTFSTELEACKEYKIQHGVWSECQGWKSQTKVIVTDDCGLLKPDFHLQTNSSGATQYNFVRCNDLEIYMDASASRGELKFYIDLWKKNAGVYQKIATKGTTGWEKGQAGIFNLKTIFPGIVFNSGEYKIKLAVANACKGWDPLEKEFKIQNSIGVPRINFATLGSHQYGTSLYSQATFLPNEFIWIQSPNSTSPNNNLVKYRMEVQRINTVVPLNTTSIANMQTSPGPVPTLFKLRDFIAINQLPLGHYRLIIVAFNECGEYDFQSREFRIKLSH